MNVKCWSLQERGLGHTKLEKFFLLTIPEGLNDVAGFAVEDEVIRFFLVNWRFNI